MAKQVREFLVEEPGLSACEVRALSPGVLGFCVTCDDTYYGFSDYKPVPLGKFLCDLGLTAGDCAQAIDCWEQLSGGARSNQPSA